MDTESDQTAGMLGATISERRRTASVSDDYSVQKTNDDATESKFVAIQLKYWDDPFIGHFIYAGAETTHHRDPEISRGYWARIASVTSLATQFIQGVGPSAQVVNIGCGFDTLYWRLKEGGLKFSKYVEMDFSSVTSKKIRQIRRSHKPPSPTLADYFSQPIAESQHNDLHAGDYHLLGLDLRQIREFHDKLTLAELDFSQPTLFIAECVLVYMDEAQSAALLQEITTRFTSISFINYEQVNMRDSFGDVMIDNLSKRGILLPGLSPCQSLQAQKERFLHAGFTHVCAWTMEELYQQYLNPFEISRIEGIEPLDERELLSQLLHHYCLVYSTKGQASGLAELIVK